MMRAIKRAFVIGNGFPGAENQCLGLVRALGLSHRLTLFRVNRPRGGINRWLQWLPVSLHKKLNRVMELSNRSCEFAVAAEGQELRYIPAGEKGFRSILEADALQIAKVAHETSDKDGPILLVASGRDTISIASHVKLLAPEHVFVVQIQHPRTRLNRFDLVITPRHDYYPLTPEAQEQIPWFLRGLITPRKPPDKRVVLTMGALHQVDSTALHNAASSWHDVLSALPKPILVVNIGGPAKHCRYDADLAKQLTISLHNVLPTCGRLRISFSRRTPKKVSDIIMAEFRNHPKVYIWDGEDPNPHMGHLAWADAFVITADSVSMLSESCSTGKPVYVIGAERCTWKFADFHKSLRERGAVRPFTGEENISESWTYDPLNDNAEAAARVIEALAERNWRLQH